MGTLTIALMDPPYESETTTTALRIADAAVRKGHKVNVFAYEGAVSLTIKDQAPHANPVKGTSAEQEDHPTTAKFVAGLLRTEGVQWINCGLCVDERGAGNRVAGAKLGSPADLLKWSQESTNTIIMGTK
ncbi:MAG: FeS-binding protein [SAR202 cluster bacterium]|nr:FeS-binding protein [SAR202 cluster bacterium]